MQTYKELKHEMCHHLKRYTRWKPQVFLLEISCMFVYVLFDCTVEAGSLLWDLGDFSENNFEY